MESAVETPVGPDRPAADDCAPCAADAVGGAQVAVATRAAAAGAAQRPAVAAPARGNARLTLVACILGSAVVFIDGTVVNVALPAMRADLGAALSDQQWVVDAYLLTLGSLVLLGGSLGDLLGRRRIFTAGLVGFGLASALCAVAPSMGVLIGVRALQGVAGALLVPSSLAIITETFEGPARGAAIGAWTAWTAGAIAFGPPLGGALVDGVSWRAVFAINVPLIVATLWLVARAVPDLPGRQRPIDVRGAVLCALGLAGPVYGLIEAPVRGWGDPVVIGSLVVGLILLVAFVIEERHAKEPMLPLELFAVRNFSATNAATLLIYGGLGSGLFLVALYVQQVAGYSALAAGATLMPVTVMLIAFSRRFGALAVRIGPRPLMGFGPLVAAAGMALFARLGQHVSYATDLLPAAVVFGLGMSATVAPLTTTVLESTDPARAGVASGVNNAIARIAGLLAIAVVGLLVATRFSSVLDSRVATARLDAGARAEVATLRTRPLTRPPSGVPAVVARASADASVEAFRYGIVASALLLGAGGLISLVALDHSVRRPSAT